MKRVLGYAAPEPSTTRKFSFAKPASLLANPPASNSVSIGQLVTTLGLPPTGGTPSIAERESLMTNPRAPIVQHKTRGKLPTGDLTDEDRQQLLNHLESEVTTSGTAVARTSCWQTWSKLHYRWFGSATEVLPLTPNGLRAIAAQMKSGGYRSFPNFVCAVKDAHLDQGHPWTDELERSRRKCEASTQRGIGPPKQCTEIAPAQVASLDLGHEPLVPGGPVCPAHWATLCTFHILRGAESACALASTLVLDHAAKTETLGLPVSKADPQAIGCKRTWGCVC